MNNSDNIRPIDSDFRSLIEAELSYDDVSARPLHGDENTAGADLIQQPVGDDEHYFDLIRQEMEYELVAARTGDPETISGEQLYPRPSRELSPLARALFDEAALSPNGVIAEFIGAISGSRWPKRPFSDYRALLKLQERIVGSDNEALGRLLSPIRNFLDSQRSTTHLHALMGDVVSSQKASFAVLYVKDKLGWRYLHLAGEARCPEPLRCPFGPDWEDVLDTPIGLSCFADAAKLSRVKQDTHLNSWRTAVIERLACIQATNVFGGLAQREAVQSCARVVASTRRGGKFALWINYKLKQDFDGAQRSAIKYLGDSVGLLVDEVVEESPSYVSSSLASEFLSVMEVANRASAKLTASSFGTESNLQHRVTHDESDLRDSMESLLNSILGLYGLDSTKLAGSATFYLLDRNQSSVRPVASVGPLRIRELNSASSQSVLMGEGVVSWVALKQGPLVVDDIERSLFRSIYRRLDQESRSECAVPVFVGSRLVGVLNLESKTPFAFWRYPDRVSPVLWASLAAGAVSRVVEAHETAQLLSRHYSAMKSIVSIVNDTGSLGAEAWWTEWAKHATEFVGASKACVYQYSNDGVWVHLASYASDEVGSSEVGEPAENPLRACGLSKFSVQNGVFVLRTLAVGDDAKRVVLVRDIAEAGDGSWKTLSDWCEQKGMEEPPPRDRQPAKRMFVGVPVSFNNMQIIAWFDFDLQSSIQGISPFEVVRAIAIARSDGSGESAWSPNDEITTRISDIPKLYVPDAA